MSHLVNPFRFGVDDGIPRENLVAYLRFNNNVDNEANAITTGSSGVTYGNGLYSGNSNEAVYFNSTSDYVTITNNSILSFGNGSTDSPFSISVAINLDSGFSGTQTIVNKRSTTVDTNLEYDFVVRGSDSKVRMTLYNYDTTGVDFNRRIGAYGDTVLTNGTDYHIVATYDGSGNDTGIQIYIDGVAESMTTASAGTYTAMDHRSADVNIGLLIFAGGSEFEGYMDGLGIWDKELSAAEVTAIYNEQSAGNEIL